MGTCLSTPRSVEEEKNATPRAETPKIAETTPQSTREMLHSIFSISRKASKEPPTPQKSSNKAWSFDMHDVRGLDFASPDLLRPHGIPGGLSVLIALVFTVRSIFGLNSALQSPVVAFYVLISLVSSVGAFGLLQKAPSSVRLFFQMGIMLQVGLLYFVYRFNFFPRFVHPAVPAQVAHWADIVMAGLMTSSIMIMAKNTLQNTANSSAGLKSATLVAIGGISALCGYPIQLAVLGSPWLSQVIKWYPVQMVAFTYYVYIPASLGLNVIFFAATLHIRKLVSTKTFVSIILVFVLGTLVPTVLSQEFHIAYRSTQKLLIFKGPTRGCKSWC